APGKNRSVKWQKTRPARWPSFARYRKNVYARIGGGRTRRRSRGETESCATDGRRAATRFRCASVDRQASGSRHEPLCSLLLKGSQRLLRPPIGRDKGIGFRAFATIFLETHFKPFECRRALVQRDAKGSAFSPHFENACLPQLFIKGTFWKRNRHTFRFGQSLRLHRLRTRDQANRIDFSTFELPFGRVQKQQQTIRVPHESYPKTCSRTSHSAVGEPVSLVCRGDMPRTNSDYLAVLRLLSECRGDEWD